MKVGQLVQAASIIGVALFMMAAGASATTIFPPVTFDTNNTGVFSNTGFNGTGNLVLTSTSGQAATLTYTPNAGESTGVPSFIDFGHFILSCPTCTATLGATFASFTFQLVIDDNTDGGVGTFTGTFTAAGGPNVYGDVSNVSINWAPLQLGPGTAGATQNSFGPTFFNTTNPTQIVNPTSGCPIICGQTTVQGSINSIVISNSSVPEPATLSLIGGGLLGLGMLSRKRSARK